MKINKLTLTLCCNSKQMNVANHSEFRGEMIILYLQGLGFTKDGDKTFTKLCNFLSYPSLKLYRPISSQCFLWWAAVSCFLSGNIELLSENPIEAVSHFGFGKNSLSTRFYQFLPVLTNCAGKLHKYHSQVCQSEQTGMSIWTDRYVNLNRQVCQC